MSSEIADAVTKVMRDFLGRGPRESRAVIHVTTVYVHLGDVYTVAEKSLIGEAREDAVLASRATIQAALRDRIVAIVEEITGRAAVAYMSTNHVDPDLAIEIVELDREPDVPA